MCACDAPGLVPLQRERWPHARMARTSASAPRLASRRVCCSGPLRHAGAKEVTVARHGLLSLAGLALGPHVEVLWLQGNKLAALTHLDACIRLRELYAHVIQRSQMP